MKPSKLKASGLYRPEFEKDSCGFGLIAQMDDEPSHWLVSTSIGALARLTHRGAVAADGKTGDGCGLLMKKPDAFLRAKATGLGIELSDLYAVGMIFLSKEPAKAAFAKETLEAEIVKEGLSIQGWRDVPVNTEACGEQALLTLPQIEQLFVGAPASMESTELDRLLYIARRRAEKLIEPTDEVFYVTSLSSSVISYKGLVMPEALPVFYTELNDPELTSSVCVFHQRFATNTFPQWRLAQPFRYLAHNGEINTIEGNRSWAQARSFTFETPLIPSLDDIRPWVSMEGSDSSSMDNMLEGLRAGGMDMFRIMRMLVPPAWQNMDAMDSDLRAFYEYNSMHMEAWDGPAAIVMTDGRYASCCLDRNGLRPARYVITKDRHITLASEIGVYEYKPEDVVAKGRLKPGEMLAADTLTGELLLPKDIDEKLKSRQPYRKWLAKNTQYLSTPRKSDPLTSKPLSEELLSTYEKFFQVTFEEKDQVLKVLANAGLEAIGSMGDDKPLPVLSKQVRSIYDNFRQQFAQVTNPPIDPIREQVVMSLETCFGREKNMFTETAEHAARLVCDSPVLSESKFSQLLAMKGENYSHMVANLSYAASGSLEEAIKAVCQQVEVAVRDGKVVIVLSDRTLKEGELVIPALLATGAVHHHLIKQGLRCNANLVVETGTARDSHQIAVLIGCGASAVYPYLAYEVLHSMMVSGEVEGQSESDLSKSYRRGVNKGLYKITSKMGISTIGSYRGAQLFECVGLADEVIDLCFSGMTSRLKGASFGDLELDTEKLLSAAWNSRKVQSQGGLLKFVHGGEYHAYNPDVVGTLQKAVQSGLKSDYQIYADLVNKRSPAMLRDLLKLNTEACTAISVDEVESADAIFTRFDSAAMSLGALSPEAHETLAIAMNELGGRSNSGEGGEDPVRFGTNKLSKIKQIASGRFGVTPHYLVNAEVLQIKVAQGAKPGEGGQLPGDKVNKMIAALRYATPGVSLISPPPHHDIYSIEDLSQLIYDLKQVNPEALVSVKLVSEAGVGTIAAGVAKAYADLITISGHDGGTGASPLTSVHNAGSPWELGLAETHQTLLGNDLRDKVRIQADGGLKTGLDVIKAAILGAETFGFGTGPMVAMGCKYLRICHLNNCATGIATQHKVLRAKHYRGDVEFVKNYFRFIAEEVREWLALLGLKSVQDAVGRTDLLKTIEGETAKQGALDLSPILEINPEYRHKTPYCASPKNEPFDKGELAEQMVVEALPAIESKSGGEFTYTVGNINRSIGARLSGEIARRHGNQGMAEQPITLKLQGSAGQSFGVWNAGGLNMYLDGDANDYVGKGMAGGKLVIRPPQGSEFVSHEATIMGNTCLYGATGGKLLASGRAGERFCVRNSGALAVVEGIGDHGCEYMTGGAVVVLGETGFNFGAGMTGGFAFILDEDRQFVDRYNHELIEIHRIQSETMRTHRDYLLELIEEFVEETGSEHGQEIIDNFSSYLPKFWLVKPKAADIKSLLNSLRKAA